MSYPPPRLKPAPSWRGLKKPEGRQWEEDFFRGARFTPAIGYSGQPPSYDQSTQMVVNSQRSLGWDPKNPQGPSRNLFSAVRRKLMGSQGHQLQLHCAVGSYLDVVHGTDGFFTLEDDPVGFAVGFDLRIGWRNIIADGTIIVTRDLFESRLNKTALLIASMINVPRFERKKFLHSQLRIQAQTDLRPRIQ